MGVAKRSHSLYRAALRKRVAEGRQGKQSIALRNSIHGPVQHLLGLLCFGCSKQTSGLCGGVSVFAIFVESFTILERR